MLITDVSMINTTMKQNIINVGTQLMFLLFNNYPVVNYKHLVIHNDLQIQTCTFCTLKDKFGTCFGPYMYMYYDELKY
jgi:hypothetical protein